MLGLLIATQTQDPGDAIWRKCVAKVNSVRTVSCEELSSNPPDPFIVLKNRYEVDRHGDCFEVFRSRNKKADGSRIHLYFRHRGKTIHGVVTKDKVRLDSFDFEPFPDVYEEIWDKQIKNPLTFQKTTFAGAPAYEFAETEPESKVMNEVQLSQMAHPKANITFEYYFDPETLLPIGFALEDKENGFSSQIQITQTVINADPKSWNLSKDAAVRMAQDWLANGF